MSSIGRFVSSILLPLQSPFRTRKVEGGYFASSASGRAGRLTNSPPQFGHMPRIPSAHWAQNVHSNEQIRASADPGGRSRSQRSQFGLNSKGIAPDYVRVPAGTSCLSCPKTARKQFLHG